MVVEIAIITPVILVIALIAANLVYYLELCARFDRVAPDVVLALATSSSGDRAGLVKSELNRVMSSAKSIEIEVVAQKGKNPDSHSDALVLSLAPHLTTYECTLTFHPWPTQLSIAGVEGAPPVGLTYKTSITIDEYREGIVW